MDEEDAVKAPVTRLRRRLSVEGDVGSPAAPSTPTKKRLAAKPQLDNIDELAPVNSPRGKQRTNSVRSTVDAPEEKPITPARRSTRIKSNTSITSEIVQSFDSPRAKRAARRTSTAGSDTEAPLTPIRKSTRRTRKDSTSSVENQETVTKPTKQITNETISEEPEAQKASANNSLSGDSISSNSVRKSRRSNAKSENEETVTKPQIKPEAQKTSANSSLSGDSISPNSVRKSQRIAAKRTSRNSLSMNKSDSESNKSLNKSKNTLNKSHNESNTSLNKSKVKEDAPVSSPRLNNSKSMSKSLTNIPEQIKLNADANRSFNSKKLSNDVGAGDAYIFGSKTSISDQSLPISDKENIDIILNTSKRKKRESENSISPTVSEKSDKGSNKRKSSDKPDGIDTVDTSENNVANESESERFLHETKTSCENIMCKVYIEDSDSNTGSMGKNNNGSSIIADDQCVPVVDKLNESDETPVRKSDNISENLAELEKEKTTLFASKTLNSTVEPMDIDESIPANVSIINYSADNNSIKNESTKAFKDLSSTYLKELDANLNKSTTKANKSANLDKSLLSRSDEKTGNENKTTLILSQLKDDSAASDGNVTKSPRKKDKSLTNADVSESKEGKQNISVTKKSSETPVKNKLLQKTGMQTSTPVIPSNNDKKSDGSKIGTPKDSSKISNSAKDMESSDESSDDSSDEEMSRDKSGILDDEAMDAGEDYESGDSKDESERRYEEENEIIEKGETLTSDEDVSNDSDYEKDSFLVSSCEEDDELISGSGDDLSLGDNELNMTAKSKQKYNERKVKEQKKASREMYQARHGKKQSLPESSDDEDEETSMPVKKNNRQRINSSPLKSGDDSIIKPRKNNRLRLDSTNDVSAAKSDSDVSISKKKPKKKQILDDSITNENEITLIGNESIRQKKDPLKTAVKAEPMTPQKEFDISTVKFSAVMDVEQVEVNENASILKANETSDPLQATAAFDDEDSDSSSGNEEIMQNYDSMLSSLNKETKKSVKEQDTSLNLNKKSKQKSQPIIDQLNLTQTKGTQKSKGKSTESLNENSASKKANKSNITTFEDESSSDSIDLKLLLPDDTSESSVDVKKTAKDSCYPGDEDFIPLKKAEGRTNLLESIDPQKFDGSLAPTIAKTKNKSMSESSNVEVSFEAGKKDKNKSIAELADESPENTTLTKTPGSSKKKKKVSESIEVQSEPIIFEDLTPASGKKNKKHRNSINLGDDVPVESAANVSVTNSSKKKKKLSECSITIDSNGETSDNTTMSKIPGSSKKKKKLSESSEVQLDFTAFTETSDHNVSVRSKNKSKRKSISESSAIEVAPEIEDTPIIFEDRTPASEKKNKKQRNSLNLSNEVPVDIAVNVSVTSSSKKKKSSESSVTADSNDTEVPSILTPANKTKSKKLSVSTGDQVDGTNLIEEAAPSSSKKKNRKSSEQSEAKQEEASLILTPGKIKKSKKLSLSLPIDDDSIDQAEAIPSSSKKKKNRKSSEPSETTKEETTVQLAEEIDVQEVKASKRKRNSSVREEVVLDSLLDNPHDLLLTAGRQKKKRKTSKNAGEDQESIAQETEITFKSESSEAQNNQQNTKSKIKKISLENQIEEPIIPDNSNKTQRNKKRKQRDDDDLKKSKAIKDTFLENITVPRLPTTILDQLDENPIIKETGRKTKIVSTSAFEVVESRPRKNKPSQYLEESICLNADSPDKKRRKRNIEKPKVLPFVPTASTSAAGYTTNFKVNVNSKETSFIAQPSNLPNFKKDYLFNKKIKKLGTFEMYKKQRSVKLSKF